MRTSIFCWAGVMLLALSGCDGDGSSNNPPTPDVEVCGNGQDDDNDGLADCADDDCAGASGCTTQACGDGVVGMGEACDGMDLGGQTCQDLGFTGGTLACAADCTLDQSGCTTGPACGDGVVDMGEACDGMDLDGQTCEGLGFPGGTLACAANCTLDQSGCTPAPTCGNGTVDMGEACDSMDLGGQTCQDLGFGGGTLACAANCTLDSSACTPAPACGDGTVDMGEACDGMDLGGQTCQDLGFGGGTLACAADCTLDSSGCTPAPACGNGMVEMGEACDGMDLGGQTCQGLGYAGGTLACSATCMLDTSGCTAAPMEVCGNNMDDDMNGLADCLDPACAADPSCNGASCSGAIALADGVPTMGNTMGGIPMTEASCTGFNSTTARVYSFTGGSAGQSGAVQIVLESATDQGIYVVTDCDDPMSEIACADSWAGGTNEEILLNPAQGGQTIYIYVDGYVDPVDNGPFTITATWLTGEDCGNGMDDNGDGLVDCTDPLCAGTPACPEADCEDGADNNGNGDVDCEDMSCQGTMTCTPGPGAVGTPCSANNQCAATNNDPFCINEPTYGFPMGYCSEFCTPGLNDCPAGGLCLAINIGSTGGLCFDMCMTDADCRSGYYCDAVDGNICLPGSVTEVCDNGMDDDNDGLSDCADPDCQGAPGCGELVCDDWYDDDADGLYDCADASCQGTMTCTPGMGAAGTPCTANNECAANAGDPACLSEAVWSYPMGYCSEWCGIGADDCAAGALCIDVGLSGIGLCFDQCATDADCRPGYTCDPALGNVCVVAGSQPEICGNGTDDNGDGLVDCADPQCQTDPSCPEAVCDDWVDNDGEGLMDCQDGDCQGTPVCMPGAAATGAACTANNQCAATANSDPFCITEAMAGWPGGYCAEFCDGAADNCGPNAVCADLGLNPPYGNCLDLCTTDADCRAGYTCTPVGSGISVCAPS